jgi:YVTN family beta-propeller protein
MPDLSPIPIPLGHTPTRLLLSRDGRLLVALCPDEDVICLVDTATDTLTATVPCPDLGQFAVFAGEGRLYATAAAGTVAIVDIARAKVTGTLTLGGQPSCGVLSPDGRLAYIALADDLGIAVIDTVTDIMTGPFPIGVGNRPSVLAMSADGDRIYAAAQGGNKVVAVETATMSVLGTGTIAGATIFSLAISPDGSRLYAPGGILSIGKLYAVDTDTLDATAEVWVGGMPKDVTVSPDGGRAYVGSMWGHTISVIDTAEFTVVREFALRSGLGYIAMSPDGRRVYASDYVKQAVLPFTTRSHPVAVGQESEGVAEAPDGRHLCVTLPGRNAVSVTGGPKRRIAKGVRPVALVAHGNGEVYVADSAANHVKVIDTRSDKVVAVVGVTGPSDLASDPGGELVYVAGRDTLSAINVTLHTVVDSIAVPPSTTDRHLATDGTHLYVTNPGGTFSGFLTRPLRTAEPAFAPGGALNDLAAAGDGPRVVTTDYNADKVSITNPGVMPSVRSLNVPGAFRMAIGANGRVYVTGQSSNTVTVVDADQATVVGEPIPVGGGPHGIVVAADGRRLFVGGYRDGHVHVVDAVTRKTTDEILVGHSTLAMAALPDGRVYLADSRSGVLSVIETTERTIAVGKRPTGIALAPGTSRAYVANSGSGTVSVIDFAAGSVVGVPLPVGGEPSGVAVSPNGKRLYVTDGFNGSIAVIDTAINKVVTRLEDIGLLLRGAAVSADGKQLYVADAHAQKVMAIALSTGKVTGQVTLPHPFGLAVTGGSLFVTLPGERRLAALDPETLAEASDRIPLGIAVHGVCPSADGTRLYVTDPIGHLVSAVET